MKPRTPTTLTEWAQRRATLARLAAIPAGAAGRAERLAILRELGPLTDEEYHHLAELRVRGGGVGR